MRLLLDTHALLWSLDGDKRLGPTARSLLADRVNRILVSKASLWEIAFKAQTGKLNAEIQGISDTLGRNGVTLLGVGIAHLITLTGLPRQHCAPFDHLLIAQAIAESATLISDDRWMARYPVPVVSCSA